MQGGVSKWEGYADWRNRAAVKGRHGGMLAASFVLAVEVLENLAFLANASNLVIYLTKFMHLPLSRAVSEVSAFMATSFLFALVGGFLSDAFFSTFTIFLISASIEFLGLILLTIQARSPSLKPPPCVSSAASPCEAVTGSKATLLFLGLYVVAFGIGGIKGSLPSHGAEQFDDSTPNGRKQRSTFFNYFVFCLATGGLVAVTFVAWLEDNVGWEWGFGASTVSIFLSILLFLSGSRFYKNKDPRGSPLTIIFKVLLAACVVGCSRKSSSDNDAVNNSVTPTNHLVTKEDQLDEEGEKRTSQSLTNSLRFLNRAVEGKTVQRLLECSVHEVEDVKVVLKVLPIFICTIMLNTCLAQLSTYSVKQAQTMNRKIGNLTVPAASLPVFPIVFMMILAPVYDHLIIPFARRVTKSEMGISHLQRIGVGLLLSILGTAVAALVEIKRKRVVAEAGLLDSQETVPISFLWVAFQYLFLGSADLFTLAGLLEFFFTEAPSSMRSLATSLSWGSLALGYYQSSAIVPIVNSVSQIGGNSPWLGENINCNRLDLYYWLLCGLSVVNFLQYLFFAMRYKYVSTGSRK
ncbi:unnamed protein product [Microthlaspi erraticum]|uniref:Major facilitator superfamily (MFS) profile domain-containing protein n=1 Tax=Microthlaspi erraticum TaxID=1685480 RepID=A0A6D2JFN3_9BRAS|nr:unnamed protein product [Microthlaspi erraticum]